jgi:hypothetical protein
VLLAAIAAYLTTGAAIPHAAGAAGFSAPIPLPNSYFDTWHFAVNDRGEGGAVVGTMTGASFFPLGPSGGLGDPIALTVPGGFASSAQSIAINAQGRVAVALLYKDDTEKPSEVEHGGIGCCGRVALTSWQLGQQVPPVQVLSPAQPPVRAGEPRQVLAAPSLVVGPAAISALWTRESIDEFGSNEFGPEAKTDLIEAYGRFSEALHVRRVTSAPRGVQVRQLGLAADGSPFAAWLEDRDKLLGLDGRSDGALTGPLRVLRVTKMSAPEGFATESGASQKTVFAYFSDSRKRHESVLQTIARRPGHGFGRVRKIAVFSDAVDARLADGFQTFVAVWERSFGAGERGRLYTRRSSGAADPGAPQPLGLGEGQTGFVDDSGRTVIVYEVPVKHGYSEHEPVAATAERGGRFGAAQPLVPGGDGCTVENESVFDRPPLPVSPNGNAAFQVSCETPAGGGAYLIRYSP